MVFGGETHSVKSWLANEPAIADGTKRMPGRRAFHMLEQRLLIAESAVVALGTDWHYLNEEARKRPPERHEKNEGERAVVRRRKIARVEKGGGAMLRGRGTQPHGFVVFIERMFVFPSVAHSAVAMPFQ